MKRIYSANNLLGNVSGSLNFIDGTELYDRDVANVFIDTKTYFYMLDETSNDAENSPYIIMPYTNAGTKRWILSGTSYAGEVINDLGDISARTTVIDIDLNNGSIVIGEITTSAKTFTFSNPSSTGNSNFIFYLTNGGLQTITWPTSVIWPRGIAPVLKEDGVDVLIFSTNDSGTVWFGLITNPSIIEAPSVAPVNTVAPVISGIFDTDEVLTCTEGTWTGTSPIVYTYQWQANGIDITGATVLTYTILLIDIESTLTCIVTATNSAGAVDQVSNEMLPTIIAPVNTVAPVISGIFDTDEVLTCTEGTWTGTSPIVYTYQWQANGIDITGATVLTYTILLIDIESTLTCIVTATNSAGAVDQVSNEMGPPVESFYVTDYNNHQIIKVASNDLTHLDQIGSFGSDDDNFRYPHYVETDGDHIYVCDNGNSRIVKRLVSDLSYVSQIGAWGDEGGLFNGIMQLAVDNTHLYMATSYHKIAKRLASDLSAVSQIGSLGIGDDEFYTPGGITVDDTYIYVADTNNNRIVKRLKSDLSYVSKIGSNGSGNDEFNYPQAITTDGTHIYIADTNNSRIVKRLSSDLSYVSQIGSLGTGDNEFSRPHGITVDDTYIYVGDTENDRVVKRLKSDLSYVSQNTNFSEPQGTGALNPLLF